MTSAEAVNRLKSDIYEYADFQDNPNEDEFWEAFDMAIKALEQEPKTGHWIYSRAVNTGEIVFSECSVCGNGESGCALRMNYCPNCGAKMEAEE